MSDNTVQEFLRQLRENPTDESLRLVAADALQEAGVIDEEIADNLRNLAQGLYFDDDTGSLEFFQSPRYAYSTWPGKFNVRQLTREEILDGGGVNGFDFNELMKEIRASDPSERIYADDDYDDENLNQITGKLVEELQGDPWEDDDDDAYDEVG